MTAGGCLAPLPAPPLGNAAPRSVAGLLIATGSYRSGLTVARIDASGVDVLGHVDGVDSFGWVDAHTVIAMPWMPDDENTLLRIVDGVLVETIAIDEAAWVPSSRTHLELTATGEAWFASCDPQDPSPEEGASCGDEVLLRAYPAPHDRRRASDVVIEGGRLVVDSFWPDPWPRGPTVPAPADVTAAASAPAPPGATNDDPTVVCERAGQRSTYPGDETAERLEPAIFTSGKVRWVQHQPPIYELAASFSGPNVVNDPQYFYFRPCEAEPLDNYAWLGDGIWGEFAERDYGGGTWTFRIGDTELGAIDGASALRPNR